MKRLLYILNQLGQKRYVIDYTAQNIRYTGYKGEAMEFDSNEPNPWFARSHETEIIPEPKSLWMIKYVEPTSQELMFLTPDFTGTDDKNKGISLLDKEVMFRKLIDFSRKNPEVEYISLNKVEFK